MSRRIIIAAIIMVMACCVGCSSQDNSGDKVRDLDFTVVESADIPEELVKIIDEQKSKEFRLTYGTDEYLYICIGYGEMKTGGYSIAVEELYLTDTAVCVDTQLIGPQKGETVTDTVTTPYIVIKTEYYDGTVMFK